MSRWRRQQRKRERHRRDYAKFLKTLRSLDMTQFLNTIDIEQMLPQMLVKKT